MKVHEMDPLDFKDVFIRPRPSSVNSRGDVNLEVEYIGRHSNRHWKGIPILASNMYSIGKIEAGFILESEDMGVCLHKYYGENEVVNYFNTLLQHMSYSDSVPKSFISIGLCEESWDLLHRIENIMGPTLFNHINICIDVANGYTERFVNFVQETRKKFPYNFIMAGNVCTGEGAQNLFNNGADIIKVGIGNGCFIAGTQVATKNGKKSIEYVYEGDEVLTHKGRFKKVLNTFSRKERDVLFNVNGITCTGNHEFYIIDKRNIGPLKPLEIYKRATWKRADELDKDDHLIQIKQYQPQLVRIDTLQSFSINKKTVFDLEVEDDHSYCVNNSIVVHNSVCTTRLMTGIGCPQISAIMECKEAIHKGGGLICGDGGIQQIGDINKAIVAGADFIMIGGMFAAHNETDNEFFGMASQRAQDSLNGGIPEYGAPEGKEISIKCNNGPLLNTIKNIKGGMRSACTYTNSQDLRELQGAQLIKTTVQENKMFNAAFN